MSGIYPPWNWQLTPENRPLEKEIPMECTWQCVDGKCICKYKAHLSYCSSCKSQNVIRAYWESFDTLWDLLKMTRLEQGNQIAIWHGIAKSINTISANLSNNWSSDIVSSSLATTKKKLATFHLSLSYWANPDWFPGTLRPAALPRLPLRRPPPPVCERTTLFFAPGATWRIIPVSKWLGSPIYKPFSPFGRGIPLLRGPTNHGY